MMPFLQRKTVRLALVLGASVAAGLLLASLLLGRSAPGRPEQPAAAASTPAVAAVPGSASGAAPNPAPPVTPMTSGEASGLERAPCRHAPATPRAAPTRSASTIRGRRRVVTIS